VITNNNETIVCDDIPPVVCKQHDKTVRGQAKKIAICLLLRNVNAEGP